MLLLIISGDTGLTTAEVFPFLTGGFKRLMLRVWPVPRGGDNEPSMLAPSHDCAYILLLLAHLIQPVICIPHSLIRAYYIFAETLWGISKCK